MQPHHSKVRLHGGHTLLESRHAARAVPTCKHTHTHTQDQTRHTQQVQSNTHSHARYRTGPPASTEACGPAAHRKSSHTSRATACRVRGSCGQKRPPSQPGLWQHWQHRRPRPWSRCPSSCPWSACIPARPCRPCHVHSPAPASLCLCLCRRHRPPRRRRPLRQLATVALALIRRAGTARASFTI